MTAETAIHTYVLADSDRRDRELAARLSAWKEGRHSACTAIADAYETGFRDGITAYKRTQHAILAGAALEHQRWGPGGREHFADARPGDYPGGPVTW